MDVQKALRELYHEKKLLDAAINSLEAKLRASNGDSGVKRRGRKGMTEQERVEVSRRMTQYWADRRRQSALPSMEALNGHSVQMAS